jgi:hypothetical protein
MGSWLKRQDSAPGIAAGELKIVQASADRANARAGVGGVGPGALLPLCAAPASSARPLVAGKKAPPISPSRVEAAPRSETAKPFLSPVRDPGF